VKERGATLSVGQRQLLSFARALAHDPHLLIMDEATSSVDTETESLIQEALETLLKGRTNIVVAHRLSTIRRANRILVLHQGKIVEAGTHIELLERGGVYSRLYQLQFCNQESRA
ncbi:MAG TPA: ATP-binding cassette domain-containing protein, partial [Candidatus Latescibacteria bacterium]|nr:ATP-binding cassette domain-containing protein [Candidatus Latescibacterota bacterium]